MKTARLWGWTAGAIRAELVRLGAWMDSKTAARMGYSFTWNITENGRRVWISSTMHGMGHNEPSSYGTTVRLFEINVDGDALYEVKP